MQFIKPDVSTMCMGMAASMGSGPADGRRQGQAVRCRTPRDDPPALGRAQGQATDIEIHAREILKTREAQPIYAERTGQPLEDRRRHGSRHFLSAEEAKATA